MIAWFFGSLCIVATLYVVLSRVAPLKVILGYATSIDVIFTCGMLVLFHGTLTGIMSATLAGLILACSLSAGRWLFGYKRYSLLRRRMQDYPGQVQRLKLGMQRAYDGYVNKT